MLYDSVTEEKFIWLNGNETTAVDLHNSAVKRNGEWQKWTYAQYLEETREERTKK
jgi:hypothetical protein